MTSGYRKLTTVCLAAVLAFGLAACGGGGTTTAPPEPDPTPYEVAVAGIAAATTAAEAQAAYDAVKDDVTAAEGARLQAAVDAQVAVLATMGRAAAQKTALMTAADNIDTSDLSTQAAIAAAMSAIAALKMAIEAAADVSDADKAMYEGQVTAAQSDVDHATQTMALAAAATALRAIDLTGLTTQAAIEAAEDAIAALRMALDAATELSDAEKAVAATELATANRIVMAAQGRVDAGSQMMALSEAHTALGMIDLENLMTQEDISAAERAIIALDLALEQATNLTDAQKLDATVDVTVAKRRVTAAKETLVANVEGQKMALTEAGTTLAALDLTNLDTAEKIAAANSAVMALKAALEGATHLSDSETAAYQTQLDAATEAVTMAQTGMDREERRTAQMAALVSAAKELTTALDALGTDEAAPTQEQIAAAETALAALNTALEEAVDLDSGEKSAANQAVAGAGGRIAGAKQARMIADAAAQKAAEEEAKRMAEEMTAAGKALKGKLGPLVGLTSATLTSAGLTTVTADPDGAGPRDAATAATLSAGDSAGSSGGWAGTHYAHKHAATGVANSAIVYANRGELTVKPFATGASFGADQAAFNAAYDATTRTLNLGANPDALSAIKGDGFPTVGTTTYQNTEAEPANIRGTYQGAPGLYTCSAATCTAAAATTASGAAAIDLGGQWYFVHDVGAMTSRGDSNYLYFGWWLVKDKDGNPTHANSFIGTAGTAPTALTGVDAIVGSATYSGGAAGKFAINDPINGGDAGHFTADATLNAKFSGGGAGISGTLDNFMANDKSVPWSVALNNTGTTTAAANSTNNIGADGAIAAIADNADTPNVNEALSTVWSIDGHAASASGTWSGQMYDETQGAADDGIDVPTSVTGRFISHFGSTHTMVGAFGATKE